MIPVSTKMLWGLHAFPEPLCLRMGAEVMEMLPLKLLGVNLALTVPFTWRSSCQQWCDGCVDLVVSSQPSGKAGQGKDLLK